MNKVLNVKGSINNRDDIKYILKGANTMKKSLHSVKDIFFSEIKKISDEYNSFDDYNEPESHTALTKSDIDYDYDFCDFEEVTHVTEITNMKSISIYLNPDDENIYPFSPEITPAFLSGFNCIISSSKEIAATATFSSSSRKVHTNNEKWTSFVSQVIRESYRVTEEFPTDKLAYYRHKKDIDDYNKGIYCAVREIKKIAEHNMF